MLPHSVIRRKACITIQSRNLTTTVRKRSLVSTQIETAKAFSVPLSIADIHLRHEQLPFAYFFNEILQAQELETTFAQVLKHFPTAGGNLINYQRIHCSADDTVPLTFADMDITLDEWLSVHRGHLHQAGHGRHPTLLPLFDPLFETNTASGSGSQDGNESFENLMTARVTYFADNSGTALTINSNHLLGDTASCLQLVECWGKAYSQETFGVPCLDRSAVSCIGMMTPDVVDLLGINVGQKKNKHSYSWFSGWFDELAEKERDTSSTGESSLLPLTHHEYVPLAFPSKVLIAMKAHGMKTCKTTSSNNKYVSTNDMVMAVAWLLKRSLSKDHDSNLSVVVNLRGRCGVSVFDEESAKSGLFGNGITNVIAELAPSTHDGEIAISNVSTAAQAIRQAILRGLEDIPHRLAQSRRGRPVPTARSSVGIFSTTSWSQLSPRDISFSPTSPLVSFHGQPSHPLPTGRTFTSVIHSDLKHRGLTVELFLPTDEVHEANRLHAQICELFLEWDSEE